MQITHSLPDLLGPNLRVFFVGDNPGLTTQSHGHHYSHKSNHFWPLLYESGLIDKPLKPIDDHLLPIKYRLGLSCLVSRATSSSHELGDQELIDGFKVMVNKINACNPQIVCFNGKGIFEKLTGKKLTRDQLGLQHDNCFPHLEHLRFFVVPSTSSRSADYTKDQKLFYFKQLAALTI